MRIKTLALTALAVAALVVPAAAQMNSQSAPNTWGAQNTSNFPGANLLPCDQLIGTEVKTTDGTEVGDLDEIVVFPTGEQVAFCVVSTKGGFLGLGDSDKVAVPWTAFSFYQKGPDEYDSVLNATHDQLRNAIHVKDLQSHLGDETYVRDVYDAFGPQYQSDFDRLFASAGTYQPQQYGWNASGQGWSSTQGSDRLEISQIVGTDVEDPTDQNLGSIDEVACDANTGTLAYGIVAVNGDVKSSLDLSNDHVAIPWQVIEPGQQDDFVVDVTEQMLPSLAFNFDQQGIQPLENPTFAMQVDRTVGVQPFWTAMNQMPNRYATNSQSDYGQPYGTTPYGQPYDATPYGQPYGQPYNQYDQQYGQPYNQQYGQRGMMGSGYQRGMMRGQMMRGQMMGRNTWNMGGQMGYGMGQGYMNDTFARGRPITVEGKIQNVYTHMSDGMNELVLRIKAENGKSLFIQAGPSWYARQQDISFRKGEHVNVTGMLIPGPTDQDNTVVARTINTRNQSLTLRNPQMQPEWARR